MNPWNQNLFVYGYVNINLDKPEAYSELAIAPVDVVFHSSIRGKDMDDEEWKTIQ